MALPGIRQPESKPFGRNRILDCLLNDVMQVFPALNVPTGPRTEEFPEEVGFPAFKTSARCCVHGNEKWPPPREIPSTDSSTIYSTGMNNMIKKLLSTPGY